MMTLFINSLHNFYLTLNYYEKLYEFIKIYTSPLVFILITSNHIKEVKI